MVILMDMVLVRREDPCAALIQIDLQDTKTGRVARGMPNVEAWRQFKEVAVESLPVEVEFEICWKVYTKIRTSSDGVEGMLQFCLVDIDGHLGANEVFQPSSMVEMQVAHDDGLHVLDVVACLRNLGFELMLF